MDLASEKGQLRVVRSWDPKSGTFTDPKSAKSRRTLTMPEVVRDALRAHRDAGGVRRIAGLVFPGKDADRPPPHSGILGRAKRAWKLADLPPLACDLAALDRDETPLPEFAAMGLHEFRHGYGSMLLRAGVDVADVSQMMGHANPGITLGIYVHATPGAEDENAAAVDALIARTTG